MTQESALCFKYSQLWTYFCPPPWSLSSDCSPRPLGNDLLRHVLRPTPTMVSAISALKPSLLPLPPVKVISFPLSTGLNPMQGLFTVYRKV